MSEVGHGDRHAVSLERNSPTMKICIVSDSHDRAEPLSAAVKQALAAGAQV
jgi:hypothetical protein